MVCERAATKHVAQKRNDRSASCPHRFVARAQSKVSSKHDYCKRDAACVTVKLIY